MPILGTILGGEPEEAATTGGGFDGGFSGGFDGGTIPDQFITNDANTFITSDGNTFLARG